ncbi:MAG: bifunctional 5,10-methylenetetrahydrofolate dehydrogenase/5,10-methenyltetrahydrofolate cyclohydrolase [Chloroflexi bacterium]|nr:bifunctional 5,10-methylenetetrahydrofolate dehydrogenase/5,10-methenyltetrahydrofolate cyclohydrolase [Chloroflexota bacterium]
MTVILDGTALAATLREELRADVERLNQSGITPRLDVVQVAGDAASDWYVRAIKRACQQIGVVFNLDQLPADSTQQQILAQIHTLNAQPETHGIIVQVPLPKHIDADAVIEAIDPRKDVDGQSPLSLGRLAQSLPTFVPNTPAGGMEFLKRYNIPIAGKQAVVVGRSNIVGKPMALLLLQEHATVTIGHSRTPDLAAILRDADIVAVAVGRPGIVHGAMLKPGATVIDFGINEVGPKTIVGDVDYPSAAEVAGAITPVPGGTGPVTNMMLLRNVIRAAEGLGS